MTLDTFSDIDRYKNINRYRKEMERHTRNDGQFAECGGREGAPQTQIVSKESGPDEHCSVQQERQRLDNASLFAQKDP